MSSFRHLFAALSIASTMVSSSQAVVIALYDFEAGGSGDTFAGQAGLNSVDAELNSTATILTSDGLDGGGANNIFNGAQTGSDSGAPLANWGNSNNPEAAANFAQFTTFPLSGQQITYESLSLFHGSFNATGQIKITYSFAGGAEVNALPPLSHTAANADPLTLAVEDFPDFTTTETVTWRVYAFGTDAENTGTRLDDITINGTVAPIPEPSSILLSLLGMIAFIGRRDRGSRGC